MSATAERPCECPACRERSKPCECPNPTRFYMYGDQVRCNECLRPVPPEKKVSVPADGCVVASRPGIAAPVDLKRLSLFARVRRALF